ncbi:MAG: hypothetical protein KBA71_14030, partial [Opitutaceae bacterium]|nr:hypothetical protein [Opitutaceae bacterium]
MSIFLKQWKKRHTRRKSGAAAFTLGEILVTLAVASIVLLAAGSIFISGNVTAKKITTLNKVTVTGRFSFDHLSREMSLADDLKAGNFINESSTETGTYSRLTYRVNLGLPGVTQFTSTGSSTLVVDNLHPDTHPQAGDFVSVGSPQLNGGTGARIVSVTDERGTGGPVTLTFASTIQAMAGAAVDIQALQVATFQRERAYEAMDVNGEPSFVWYEAYNASSPGT